MTAPSPDEGRALGAAAPKRFLGGTHRTRDPAETLTLLQPRLGPMGVTRVAVVTGLDVIGIPVVMVCRPNSRSLSVSQGKGTSLVTAKVSGIMESAEGWHAENALVPLRLATYRELRNVATVVDVEQLPRASWSRFHADLSILWAEGVDVLSSERVWVPYETVHLDFRVPGPQGTGCFLTTGTGLAAGNNLLEAVSHALCEVIERDAFALAGDWSPAERAQRRIDPDTVDDPECRLLLDAYAAADVAVAIFDLTSDVGLPVFSATVADRDPDSVRRLPAAKGGGCHPDRGIALSRALTEAAQSRLTIIAGSRDDCPPAYYRRVRDPDALAAGVNAASDRGRRSFLDVPNVAADDIGADVAGALDRLRSVGVERVVLVDLTRPDVGIPVVRMVVPGMEGFADKVSGLVPGARRRRVMQMAAS